MKKSVKKEIKKAIKKGGKVAGGAAGVVGAGYLTMLGIGKVASNIEAHKHSGIRW